MVLKLVTKLVDLYTNKLMRAWCRYYYNKTRKPIFFWVSLAIDIILILFIIWFITNVTGILETYFEDEFLN